MGCGGSFFFSLLITAAVALITAAIVLISFTAPLTSGGLPGLRTTSSSSVSLDPVIRMPLGRHRHHHHQRRRLFHSAVTASDSVYSAWQCRGMYYWFKKARAAPGSDMGGFTRILHSGKPDQFMDEIPTFVADPLPAGMDQGYIVLNRPWAFVQWLQNANILEDLYQTSLKKVLQLRSLSSTLNPKSIESTLRKFFPVDKGLITDIDPIGNSPLIVKKASLMKIAPTWMNVSLAMKKDPEADKAFAGYAYAVASALHGVGNILHKDFMIQPPWDLEVGEKFIIHYTYGCDYDLKDHSTYGKIGEWRFDKRSYDHEPPPRNLALSPPGVPQSVATLVKMFNEATANILDWEAYVDGSNSN